MNYLGAASPDADNPHVFFIAQPRLMTPDNKTIVFPAHFQFDEVANPAWYHAQLTPDHISPSEGISLMVGGDIIPLLEPQNISITLEKDFGNSLGFQLSETLRTVVWINGKPCFSTVLFKGESYLLIPPLYLTGQYSQLELRDPSGTCVFWKSWFLPPRQSTPLEVLQAEGSSPLPNDLFAQSPFRFKALRAHLNAGSSPKMLAQANWALEVLEAGYDQVKLAPLSFPKVKSPDVSIIIPAHNKVNVTYAGLAALLLAWNKASFEVILVDDASTDETTEIENIVSGIKVVRNETAQRFIRACNAGVAKARGKYVVLLNNDTEPTTGWLDELIEAFERFPNVGLVGSKLLYPNGELQDAGGIIWGSGDPWNYGNRQNPWEPRFCYARQADYLSGAALMTTRKIWDQVGGLSSYLEPMYFEDTDFAFKVRDAGYSTWFVPASIVYHYEGMTSGTDTSSGFKKYQEVNRPKFKRQWAKAFSNFSKVKAQPDLEKDRGIVGRVLFVDYTTPTSDQSAGGYAALQEIKLVQSLGYKVTFLPENIGYMGKYTSHLEKMGVEVITSPFFRSINQFLDQRGSEFDAFYITRYHVVNAVVPKIRAVNPLARIIMNNADLHFLRLLRRASAANDETLMDEVRQVRTEELAAMKSVDVVLSYNEMEHAVIEAQSEGRVKVMTCPWVLEVPETLLPRDGREGLSFLGGFQHHPNVEGIEWFAGSVMGLLEQERPDIKLSIYGSRMTDSVKDLASAVIDPIGFVKDVADAYNRHLVFVAPLLSGAGIKGKVLSALAHGVPCVLSPLAAEGIGVRDGHDCLIADTPEEWLAAITRLYDDPVLWQTISQNAYDLAKTKFSFEQGQNKMRAVFEKIGLFDHIE